MSAGAAVVCDDFRVGDDVYCLAWIGLPFKVVARDDEAGCISIAGTLPSSLHNGVQLDIYSHNLFMLTHETWDQIWYWPDRLGETYMQVFDRFVAAHRDGEVVNAYSAPTLEGLGIMSVDRDPELAQAFRLDLSRVDSHRQIKAHAVCAIVDGGTAIRGDHDPSIADADWMKTGPTIAAQVEMVGYRWSITAGRLLLNVEDFG